MLMGRVYVRGSCCNRFKLLVGSWNEVFVAIVFLNAQSQSPETFVAQLRLYSIQIGLKLSCRQWGQKPILSCYKDRRRRFCPSSLVTRPKFMNRAC